MVLLAVRVPSALLTRVRQSHPRCGQKRVTAMSRAELLATPVSLSDQPDHLLAPMHLHPLFLAYPFLATFAQGVHARDPATQGFTFQQVRDCPLHSATVPDTQAYDPMLPPLPSSCTATGLRRLLWPSTRRAARCRAGCPAALLSPVPELLLLRTCIDYAASEGPGQVAGFLHQGPGHDAPLQAGL